MNSEDFYPAPFALKLLNVLRGGDLSIKLRVMIYSQIGLNTTLIKIGWLKKVIYQEKNKTYDERS